jgi:hypothetical protein
LENNIDILFSPNGLLYSLSRMVAKNIRDAIQIMAVSIKSIAFRVIKLPASVRSNIPNKAIVNPKRYRGNFRYL